MSLLKRAFNPRSRLRSPLWWCATICIAAWWLALVVCLIGFGAVVIGNRPLSDSLYKVEFGLVAIGLLLVPVALLFDRVTR